MKINDHHAEDVYVWSAIELTALKGQLLKGVKQKTPDIRMLALQLSGLESNKIIEKVYPVIPSKTEYKLTNFDKTLIPIILEMEKRGQIYNFINSEERNWLDHLIY